jgi:hypothetical protein
LNTTNPSSSRASAIDRWIRFIFNLISNLIAHKHIQDFALLEHQQIVIAHLDGLDSAQRELFEQQKSSRQVLSFFEM